MIKRLTLALLLLAVSAQATPLNLVVTYELDPLVSTSGNMAWISAEIATVTANRRMAISMTVDGVVVLRQWVNSSKLRMPWDQTTDNCVVSINPTGSRPKIALQGYAYEGAPWFASTSHVIDDKLSVGDKFPNTHGYWICTRAGTSGSNEPTWPERKWLASNVIDNGGGTVNIPCATHGYLVGDVIDIEGTTNYDGSYTLQVQTNGDADNIEITATFVAETISKATVSKRVQDPDGSGAEWRYEPTAPVILESEETGWIIGKDNGSGLVIKSGFNFIYRNAP